MKNRTLATNLTLKIFIFLFLFVLNFSSFAQKSEPVVSVSDYIKGEFVTKINIVINASNAEVNEVIDKFISQYNNDLNALFTWAAKDLKLRGEKDDVIIFNIKSHDYNKSTNKVSGIMDINVEMMNKNFPNTNYETSLSKRQNINTSELIYKMYRCDKVIEYANANFIISPKTANTTEITLNVSVSLYRPYSLMSKKQYRATIEWRFAKLLSNFRDEVEK